MDKNTDEFMNVEMDGLMNEQINQWMNALIDI